MMNSAVVVTAGALLGLVFLTGGGPARTTSSQPEDPHANACGCYRDGHNACVCYRKNRCGCPGECEPIGCEEKRQKALQQRMEEELDKIRDKEEADKKGDEKDKNEKHPDDDTKQKTSKRSRP
jgi:hypothetical protein